MSLEFEKISQEIERMGQTTRRRQELRAEQIQAIKHKLKQHAQDWSTIERCVLAAKALADEKWFRAALPLDETAPLDKGIPAPALPEEAILIATDGSQILPDRHAPFLYYVINVGVVVYYHGNGRAPETFTIPQIKYPSDNLEESIIEFNSGSVSIKRDLEEIGTLAQAVIDNNHDTLPLIAILDQRLLYWPIGSIDQSESNHAIDRWLFEIDRIRTGNGILAGYIDRPDKIAVLNMVRSLDVDQPEFEIGRLMQRNQSLNDADLFSTILAPGERSPVFVDISSLNERFAEAGHEVCFFYINPTRNGRRIARIDIPVWVAKQPNAITQLHALFYHQCQILLGDYPYVLTRADEVAVVGRQDQAYLDSWIELTMQRYGVQHTQTAKQEGKDIARAGRMRHEL